MLKVPLKHVGKMKKDDINNFLSSAHSLWILGRGGGGYFKKYLIQIIKNLPARHGLFRTKNR
jgi:hypothetical protein